MLPRDARASESPSTIPISVEEVKSQGQGQPGEVGGVLYTLVPQRSPWKSFGDRLGGLCTLTLKDSSEAFASVAWCLPCEFMV